MGRRKKKSKNSGQDVYATDIPEYTTDFAQPPISKFFEKSDMMKLAYSEQYGRFVIADRAIERGECVLDMPPVAAVVRGPMLQAVCHHCIQPVRETSFECSACRSVRFCSDQCLNQARPLHVLECEALKELKEYDAQRLDTTPIRLLIRVMCTEKLQKNGYKDKMGRHRNVAQRGPGYRASDVFDLVDNAEKVEDDIKHELSETVKHLAKSVFRRLGYERERFTNLLLNIQCNAAHVTDVRKNPVALAFYPPVCYMNHSCLPNVVLDYSRDRIQVRAIRPIAKGEPICYAYTHLYATTEARRKQLKEAYYFDCQCVRCVGPVEKSEERYYTAFCCPECKCALKSWSVEQTKDSEAKEVPPTPSTSSKTSTSTSAANGQKTETAISSVKPPRERYVDDDEARDEGAGDEEEDAALKDAAMKVMMESTVGVKGPSDDVLVKCERDGCAFAGVPLSKIKEDQKAATEMLDSAMRFFREHRHVESKTLLESKLLKTKTPPERKSSDEGGDAKPRSLDWLTPTTLAIHPRNAVAFTSYSLLVMCSAVLEERKDAELYTRMWSDALTGPLWKNHPHRLDPMEAHAQSLQRLSESTEADSDKEKQEKHHYLERAIGEMEKCLEQRRLVSGPQHTKTIEVETMLRQWKANMIASAKPGAGESSSSASAATSSGGGSASAAAADGDRAATSGDAPAADSSADSKSKKKRRRRKKK